MRPTNGSNLSPLQWVEDDVFTLKGTRFTTQAFGGFNPSVDHFFLMKTPRMVESYVARLEGLDRPRVVELGIFVGGSVAFLAHLLDPKVLVAFDNRKLRARALDEFTSLHGYDIHAHYGVDQSNRSAILRLLDTDLGGEPPDLIIDDASHQLGLTRQSFDILFPLLPPGGLYVIEDWAWGLGPFSPDRNRPSLSVLVYELLLAMPYSDGGLIADVSIDPNSAVFTRGPGVIDPDVPASTLHSPRAQELARCLQTDEPDGPLRSA